MKAAGEPPLEPPAGHRAVPRVCRAGAARSPARASGPPLSPPRPVCMISAPRKSLSAKSLAHRGNRRKQRDGGNRCARAITAPRKAQGPVGAVAILWGRDRIK